ncbi:Protein phosphatase 2C 2 [Pelomyxa schiedti]|nr:Protein phosphatase 2C 2 [Pelomyxa schiedti]
MDCVLTETGTLTMTGNDGDGFEISMALAGWNVQEVHTIKPLFGIVLTPPGNATKRSLFSEATLGFVTAAQSRLWLAALTSAVGESIPSAKSPELVRSTSTPPISRTVSPPVSPPVSTNGYLFGIPIDLAISQGGGTLPPPLRLLIDGLRSANAASIENIFKVRVPEATLASAKIIIEQGDPVADIHTAASLLILYLDSLPDPLLTFNLYEPFIDLSMQEVGYLQPLKTAVSRLPSGNLASLQFLLEFFVYVISNSKVNKMDSVALGTIFGPIILKNRDPHARSPVSDAQVALLCRYCIDHYNSLFPPSPTSKVLPGTSRKGPLPGSAKMLPNARSGQTLWESMATPSTSAVLTRSVTAPLLPSQTPSSTTQALPATPTPTVSTPTVTPTRAPTPIRSASPNTAQPSSPTPIPASVPTSEALPPLERAITPTPQPPTPQEAVHVPSPASPVLTTTISPLKASSTKPPSDSRKLEKTALTASTPSITTKPQLNKSPSAEVISHRKSAPVHAASQPHLSTKETPSTHSTKSTESLLANTKPSTANSSLNLSTAPHIPLSSSSACLVTPKTASSKTPNPSSTAPPKTAIKALGGASLQGPHPTQEDRFLIISPFPNSSFKTPSGWVPDKTPAGKPYYRDFFSKMTHWTLPPSIEQETHYFAIFDGHGGHIASEYCVRNVYSLLTKDPKFETDKKAALISTFCNTDAAFKKVTPGGCGSTALVVVLCNNTLTLANAGDCRCVLGKRSRQAVALTNDHKPGLPQETQRIRNAGCSVIAEVIQNGGGKPPTTLHRVNGRLGVSRAIGDFDFKQGHLPPEMQAVTPVPEVTVHEITPDDWFMVLGCDGLWDNQTNEEVVGRIAGLLTSNPGFNDSSIETFAHCIAEESGLTDNTTAIVVVFQ